METVEHFLDTGDGAMRVVRSDPEGAPRGAVIVIMEAFGVNAHIEDVTRRVAAAGYVGVAPDLFHRGGGGFAEYDDFGKLMELFGTVTDEGVLTDIDAALDHLAGSGISAAQVGIVGFCFGGRVTFLAAARRALGAAVGFYGGGIIKAGMLPFPPLVDEVGSLQTPWLGLFGDLDAMIPPDDVEFLRRELTANAPVATEIVRYAGADHGFYCEARPQVYNPEVAADAWGRALAWFGERLG